MRAYSISFFVLFICAGGTSLAQRLPVQPTSEGVGYVIDGTHHLLQWGRDLGKGGTNRYPTRVDFPASVLSVESISSGANHAASIVEEPSGSALYVWGRLPGGFSSSTPQKIVNPESGSKWSKVVCGTSFVLALTNSGSAYAFGANDHKELGGIDTFLKASTIPNQVIFPSGTKIVDIAAVNVGAFALSSTGDIYRWGSASGFHDSIFFPQKVHQPMGIGWKSISGGYDQLYALDSQGHVYAAGSNFFGNLGLGDYNPRDSLTLITFPNQTGQIIQVIGGIHGMAVSSDGSLFGWGPNNSAELGDSTIKGRLFPERLSPNFHWIQVGAGFDYSYAIDKNCDLYMWGTNTDTDLVRWKSFLALWPVLVDTVCTIDAVENLPSIRQPIAILSVWPQPSHSSVYFRVQQTQSSGLALSVFNALGNEVKRQWIANAASPNTTLPLQIADMPAGVYWVRITNDEGTCITRLLIE